MTPAELQTEMIAQVRLATAGLARCAAEHDRGQQPGAAALKQTIRRAKRALSGVRRAVRLSDRTSDTSGRGDQ